MDRTDSLEFVRKEIAHEFTLLSSRITWFTASQSFLIAAYTLALGNPAIYKAGWLAHFIFPALGFLLCVLVAPGIWAAHKTIGLWLERQHSLFQDDEGRRAFNAIINDRFLTHPNNDTIHSVSLWFSMALPILLAAFWLGTCLLLRFWPILHP